MTVVLEQVQADRVGAKLSEIVCWMSDCERCRIPADYISVPAPYAATYVGHFQGGGLGGAPKITLSPRGRACVALLATAR